MRRETRRAEPRDSKAQLRLQKLGEMVTSLMRITNEDPNSRGENMSTHMSIADQCFNDLSPPNSDSSHEAYSYSSFSERNYVSATHWTAILKM